MKLVLVTIFLGNLHITSYQPKVAQTDSSPYSTSIGERVTIRGCAVSRDLLKKWGGPVSYGDLLYIEGYGFRHVNDCMADTEYDRKLRKHFRIRGAVDLWVPNQKEESKVNVKFKNVWIVRRDTCSTIAVESPQRIRDFGTKMK